MNAEFPSFASLMVAHREGEDFERSVIYRASSRTVVLAVHGGRIEPHTAEIATEIAGETCSLYCFRSCQRRAEANLHITSHRFDDPLCLDLAAKHPFAVAIHGCKGDRPEVLIGGLDSRLADEVAGALHARNIAVRASDHLYSGTHPMNICNRTSSRAGVQLELTMAIRSGGQRSGFVDAVRSAIATRQGAA